MKDLQVYAQVRERMLRYAKVNTQSRAFQGVWPTTACQRDLGRMLAKELGEMAGWRAEFDEEPCLVYGWLDSNLPGNAGASLGFIAHLDTAPDAPGEDVKPWVLENYDGGDILLNPEKQIIMRAAEYANLRQYIGQDLILTDGTTLLGGDDKASIAALMTLAQVLSEHPEIPHGPIRLAFTPDEEVGGLAKNLDLKRFDADAAYTLDGDHLGYYEDETFYASEARMTITGRSVHTGTAKGIMINAGEIAAELIGMIPENETPQATSGTEGFYHLVSVNGTCEKAEIRMILRDFDRGRFEARQDYLRECARKLGEKYGAERFKLEIRHQYSNMKEILRERPELAENLRKAIAMSGVTPVCEPFRGGTDGAALSFRGLPCPNLSAGYENAHGRFEYVPVSSMAKNVEILLNLCGLFAKQTRTE